MKGIVKFFNKEKGFGFIIQDGNSEEVFVHKTGLYKGTQIDKGDEVEFDTEQGKKGLQAINVSKE